MKDGFGSWLILALVMLGVVLLAQLVFVPMLRGIFTPKPKLTTAGV